MGWIEDAGAIVGLVGGLAGLAAFVMTWRTRRDSRWLRRRAIPREIEDLERDHAIERRRLEDGTRARHNDIANETGARGMYYSSFRENAQKDNQRDGAEDLDRLDREHRRKVAALEDELARLGGARRG